MADHQVQESFLLSKLCSTVGFSEHDWRLRLGESDVLITCSNFEGENVSIEKARYLSCGSASEGVAAPFLKSDVDKLTLLSGTVVIEDVRMSPGETNHVFQIVATRHPAYVRLQLLSIGCAQDVRNTLDFCIKDEEGRFVLCPTILKDKLKWKFHTPHGPALEVTTFLRDFDCVLGLQCITWPSAWAEWTRRHRPYNWPSAEVIREITERGCELVPVGNQASDARHLEWRYSSSFAEKKLVRSFNIVQIQCYFLLKLLLATLIKPVVPDVLCSYHLKHMMFYLVETTNPAEWTERNLVNCFTKCLHSLKERLQHGHCPHYFNPQHNMFHPKVQGETQETLMKVVAGLEAEGWRCLLKSQVSITALRQGRTRLFIDYEGTEQLLGILMMSSHTTYSAVLRASLLPYTEAIEMMLHSIHGTTDTDPEFYPCRELMLVIQNQLKCSLGYALLSAKIGKNAKNAELVQPVLQFAQRLLEEGCDGDLTSGRLKLATFMYQIDKKDRCLQLIQDIFGRYTDAVVPFSYFSAVLDMLNPVHAVRLFGLKHWRSDLPCLLSHVAFPVMFSGWEIPSAPAAVQELTGVKATAKKTAPVIFTIDALVYAHYLRVLCFVDLGRYAESRRALELMNDIVQNPQRFFISFPGLAHQLLSTVFATLPPLTNETQ